MLRSLLFVALLLFCLTPSRSAGRRLGGTTVIQDSQLNAIRSQGGTAYREGNFSAAEKLWEQGRSLANQRHDALAECKFLANLAGMQYAQFHYRQAIDDYLQARALADTAGLAQASVVIDFNLVSLYTILGDFNAAEKTAQASLQNLRSNAQSAELRDFQHQFDACLGLLRAHQGYFPEAYSHFQRAIDEAEADGKTGAVSHYWDYIGETLLIQGDLDRAESALTEAFRMRTLSKDPALRTSLFKLAWLRLEQNDVRSAEALLRHASALPAQEAGLPPYVIAYLRGRVLLKKGQSEEGLASLRLATRLSRMSRDLPSDTLRTSTNSDKEHRRIFNRYIEAALASDPQGVEALEASENDRAAALTDTLRRSPSWRAHAPPEYWSTLARIASAEAGILSDSEASSEHLQELRHSLMEMEIRAGLPSYSTVRTDSFEKNTAVETLRGIQDSIKPDELLLSFHLGESNWQLWAISQHACQRYELRDRKTIQSLASQFRAAVSHSSPDRDSLGAQLYQQLFGALDSKFTAHKTWLLSVSDPLFQIPYSALVLERQDAKPIYFIERHTIIHVPSAIMLTAAPAPVAAAGFLGIGDGIYNSADPRWRPTTSPWMTESKPALQLARLVGSRREVEACAAGWTSRVAPMVHFGVDANRETLQEGLRRQPELVHFATHVLAPPNRPADAAIDLGLPKGPRPELLTRDEIAGLRAPDATIVMSGCSSADSPANPGTGVEGLTRAWLLAGARAVIGSRWPTPDDTGQMFGSFYRNLRARQSEPARMRAVGESLRLAQLEMLRSASWRSNPSYWATFYVLGKE